MPRAKAWKYKPTRFMAPDSHYDQARADRAVYFISNLKHGDGEFAGEPFGLLPWQEQIIRDVFGVIGVDGYRQFRTAYIEIPKKNGKSELAAAVALYMLVADREQSAEVYSCAGDIKQAKIVFDVAKAMAEQSPALMKRLKILDATNRIVYPAQRSKYVVLSADATTKYGFKVSCCVFDELCNQPNRRLYDVMTKGAGFSRRQPLNFVITTAGPDRESIAFEVHKKALDIIDGSRADTSFYPVIFAAPDDADWTKPGVWKAANPSMGITSRLEDYKREFEDGKHSLAAEIYFRTFYLNQWVEASENSWIPMDKWDKCAFPVSPKKLEGRVCYGGLDLSSTGDLSSFVLVFSPLEGEVKYQVLPFFWIAKDRLKERIARDHVPYDIWEREEILFTTTGDVIHYAHIEQFIKAQGERYKIKEIAFDRWGADYIAQNLNEAGFTVVRFGQGYGSMSPACSDFERLMRAQEIAHGGNKALRWMAKNVIVKIDAAGNIKPDKGKSPEKIDGIVAMLMALSRAVIGGAVDRKESVYNRRGMFMIGG